MDKLIDHVRVGQRVRFEFYRSETLYYRASNGLLFEVPISDTGDAVFNAEEKAISMMKWIRRQLEENEKGRKESQGNVDTMEGSEK